MDREKAAQGRAADGVPPRMNRASQSPMNGTRPACSAATTTDHVAFWSQRSNWPVNPIASVKAEQQDARRPVHLPRKLVGAEQERLRHVGAHHQHHRGSAEVMQPAQEAAKRRIVVMKRSVS